jgi:hypothetical protein
MPPPDVTVALYRTIVPKWLGDGEAEIVVALAACPTPSGAVSLEVRKFVSPLYVAVIVSDPAGAFDALHDPLPKASVIEHSGCAPTVTATLPVGVPPDEDTVALKVTEVPKMVEEGMMLSDVVVVSCDTVRVAAFDDEGLKSALPL